jgi:hypothetical protein
MSNPRVVGCDVSKAHLDFCDALASVRRRQRIVNDAEAIEAWVGALTPGSCVGMEATGTYHELFSDPFRPTDLLRK